VPQDLQPVVKLAAKDAILIVSACIFGYITSLNDDANYTNTKK
jgi:hypothetical protein